ncbi:hypothetical protein ACFL2V_18710, partial [Pseudomonadota bacterium]
YLSELVSNGLIKVSSVKIGGSPLYFAPGQEGKLEKYIEKLHEKEQRAVNKLKLDKVLKDSELEPIVRVSLRNAKDFAKPVEVSIGGNKQIFWRYFLTPKEEVERIIRSKFMKGIPAKKPEPQQVLREEKERVYEERPKLEKTFEKPKTSNFYDKIKKYFEEHNIKVIAEEEVRRKKHYWFKLEVPASIGYLSYYCEAKDKKTISSSDLSDSLVKAQNKRLPLLYLSNGKVSKSVEEMLENEFKSVVLKTI